MATCMSHVPPFYTTRQLIGILHVITAEPLIGPKNHIVCTVSSWLRQSGRGLSVSLCALTRLRDCPCGVYCRCVVRGNRGL